MHACVVHFYDLGTSRRDCRHGAGPDDSRTTVCVEELSVCSMDHGTVVSETYSTYTTGMPTFVVPTFLTDSWKDVMCVRVDVWKRERKIFHHNDYHPNYVYVLCVCNSDESTVYVIHERRDTIHTVWNILYIYTCRAPHTRFKQTERSYRQSFPVLCRRTERILCHTIDDHLP